MSDAVFDKSWNVLSWDSCVECVFRSSKGWRLDWMVFWINKHLITVNDDGLFGEVDIRILVYWWKAKYWACGQCL